MPEMHFDARWPDGATITYYSPSLVIRDYLEVGTSYTVADFVDRARRALHIASERVHAKYGFPCVRAAATLALIEAKACDFSEAHALYVRVEADADV